MNPKIFKQTFLDVRTPEEFQTGHVEGAVNIPLDQIPRRITEIRGLLRPIVTYCQSGTRSGMAVSMMKKQDINDVVNGGGIEDVKNQYRV